MIPVTCKNQETASYALTYLIKKHPGEKHTGSALNIILDNYFNLKKNA